MCADFERSFVINEQNEVLSEKRDLYLPKKNCEIDLTTDLRAHFQNDVVRYLVDKVDDVLIEGSGFTLGEIKMLRVQIFKNGPLAGSGYIELQREIQNKRAVVNLKNTNNECFNFTHTHKAYD